MIFLQLSLIEREAMEDGCLGESLERCYPKVEEREVVEKVGENCYYWTHSCKCVYMQRCEYQHTRACSDCQTVSNVTCLTFLPDLFFFFLNGKQQFPLFLGIADDRSSSVPHRMGARCCPLPLSNQHHGLRDCCCHRARPTCPGDSSSAHHPASDSLSPSAHCGDGPGHDLSLDYSSF